VAGVLGGGRGQGGDDGSGGGVDLEIVAPEAFVTGAAGVPRLDLVAALAAATSSGEGASVESKSADFTAEVDTHYEAVDAGEDAVRVGHGWRVRPAPVALHHAPHAPRLMRDMHDQPAHLACSLPSRVNNYSLTRRQPIRHPIAAACGPPRGTPFTSAGGA